MLPGYRSTPRASFPTKSGLTLEQATKLCQDSFDASPVIQACLTKSKHDITTELGMCIEDIKVYVP